MGGSGGGSFSKSRSRSSSRTEFTPEQRRFQAQGLGLLGRQADQGFFDFGRVQYQQPMEIAPSADQVRGLRGLTNVDVGPVDYDPLRAASNASFQSRVQNSLGPQLRERAGRVAGYGTDYARAVADPIAEEALNLETFLTGLESQSAEQAQARGLQQQLGLLANLPQFQESLDPNQAFQQRQATSEYEEFLRRFDPSFLQTIVAGIPGGLQSFGSSSSNSFSLSGQSGGGVTGGGGSAL